MYLIFTFCQLYNRLLLTVTALLILKYQTYKARRDTTTFICLFFDDWHFVAHIHADLMPHLHHKSLCIT